MTPLSRKRSIVKEISENLHIKKELIKEALDIYDREAPSFISYDEIELIKIAEKELNYLRYPTKLVKIISKELKLSYTTVHSATSDIYCRQVSEDTKLRIKRCCHEHGYPLPWATLEKIVEYSGVDGKKIKWLYESKLRLLENIDSIITEAKRRDYFIEKRDNTQMVSLPSYVKEEEITEQKAEDLTEPIAKEYEIKEGGTVADEMVAEYQEKYADTEITGGFNTELLKEIETFITVSEETNASIRSVYNIISSYVKNKHKK
jgi:hypothetical protein